MSYLIKKQSRAKGIHSSVGRIRHHVHLAHPRRRRPCGLRCPCSSTPSPQDARTPARACLGTSHEDHASCHIAAQHVKAGRRQQLTTACSSGTFSFGLFFSVFSVLSRLYVSFGPSRHSKSRCWQYDHRFACTVQVQRGKSLDCRSLSSACHG